MVGQAMDAQVSTEGAERRRYPRRPVVRAAGIRRACAETCDSCIVKDISEGGARLFVHDDFAPGELVEVEIYRDDVRAWCRVMWRSGEHVGVAFVGTQQ